MSDRPASDAANGQRALYDKAFAAYSALCELEDELDALAAADGQPSTAALSELLCLDRRWREDTKRKVDRAIRARGAA